MNILIADDEYLVRASIVSMLIDSGVGASSIDEASNGQQVLEAIKIKKYHVVIIDIRMPVLDGLEAIQKAQKSQHHIRWIIISGHSEFEYAKQAIKLGVKDYLLKPVEPSDLEGLIHNISDEFKEMAHKKNQEIESELNYLYSGLFEEDSLVKYPFEYRSMHIQIDTFNDEHHKQVLKEVYNELSKRFESYINLELQIVPLSGTVADLTFVICHSTKEDVTHHIINTIQRLTMKYTDATTRFFFFYSDRCSDESQLLKEIHQIENLFELRFLSWEHPIIGLDDVKELLQVSDSNRLKMAKSLHQLYKSYYEGEYSEFISKLESLHQKDYSIDFKTLLIEAQDDEEAIDQLKLLGEHQLSAEIKTSSDIVDKVKDFAMKNYMHNIGVNQIADMFQITPNYLSTLFKKKEGITFVRFLTKIRMENAHVLLTRENIKVSEVAQKVGYYSARHFSKLYKQQFGIYPSEQ